MTVQKTIRISKPQIDQIVDKLATRLMSMIRAQLAIPSATASLAPADPVPCKRCSNPCDPDIRYCANCLEDLAEMSEWLQQFQHCDICDEKLSLRDAAEITATCQVCLHDPANKINTSIFDRAE